MSWMIVSGRLNFLEKFSKIDWQPEPEHVHLVHKAHADPTQHQGEIKLEIYY